MHTLLEILALELLERVELSMVGHLLTTKGSNQLSQALIQIAATFNRYTERGSEQLHGTKAVSPQHMKLTTTTPCLGEVTGTVKLTTHSSVE
jgi:hypothetical protein